MIYPIAIEPPTQDNECYGVIVPDLEGCFSAGDTLDEAVKNAHEAVVLHLDGLAEDDEAIPQPSNLAQLQVAYQGFIWGFVDIDLSAFLGKSEKINVTLPTRLIAKIDEKVNRQKSLYKNRSHYLAQLAVADLI